MPQPDDNEDTRDRRRFIAPALVLKQGAIRPRSKRKCICGCGRGTGVNRWYYPTCHTRVSNTVAD